MRKRVCKDDQIRLIMECRQSGLSDYQWCKQNGIHPGNFYNWVSKLRKRGYSFPDSEAKSNAVPNIQEVVKIDLIQPQDSSLKVDHNVSLVEQLKEEPNGHSIYLFCGKRCDRIKVLLREPDSFVLLYKRLDVVQGRYRWSRNKSEVKFSTWQQFDWLMSDLDIEQSKAIRTA